MPPPAGLFLLMAMLFAVAPAAMAQPGDDPDLSTRSGDWAGGCDNRGRCTMIGWASGGDYTNGERPMLLRIELLHGQSRLVRIRVQPQPAIDFYLVSRIDLPGAYVFNFPDADGGPVQIEERDYVLPDATAQILFTHLFVGHPVAAAHPRAASQRLRFAQSGFDDVYVRLRSIGVIQLRRNRAHRREQRRLLEILRGEELALEMTGVHRMPPVPYHSRCPMIIGTPYALRRFRLGGREHRELWQNSCTPRERNPVSLFYIREPGATTSAPLMLPLADGGVINAGTMGVAAGQFEFDFGVIRAVRYDGEREDCGTSWVWGWNGSSFVLLEQREMPYCGGLPQTEWIPVYMRGAVGPDR